MNSLSFVATADFHLGEEMPGMDRFAVIKQIFKYAKDNEAGFLIVAGDIYDHLVVSNKIRARFNGLVKSLSRHVEVILFPGNHDIGQHTTALAPIVPFADERVRIITKPSRFTRGGKRFLILPYTLEMAQDRKHIIKLCKKYAGKYECVFAHIAVNGVKVGPSNFTLLEGINKGTLKTYFDARYIVLGHIHKPQKGGNIYYCGSPEYLDFGEREEQKRFLFYNNGELKSIDIKNRPLAQLHISLDGYWTEYNGQRYHGAKVLNNAVYKVIVTCKKEDINKVQVKEVVSQIKECGGTVVKVSWNIKTKARMRAKHITFKESVEVNMKNYIKLHAKKSQREKLMREAKEVMNAAYKNRDK